MARQRRTRNISGLLGVLVVVSALIVSVVIVDQKTDIISKAYRELTGEKANLVINLTDSYEIPQYFWNNFSQGGEESDGMLAEVRRNISDLNPDYIRIDHIYDF